jgi:NAD(P)-dependent dehydrogenase (short-subunit alcohol dehydrogenase family)
MMSLHGRRALVTGAASGIGRATLEALRAAGAEVVGTDRDDAAASAGGALVQADLCEAEAVDALYRTVQGRLGVPDIVASCAGIGIHERLAEGDPAKWARVMEVNVLGALRLIRAFVPAMLERGGDVVIVSSVAAHTAYPWGGPYAASKAALEMLAETLRLETLPSVRVTTVAPGVVDTPFFAHMLAGNQTVEEIGFGAVHPEQVAELIAYAVSRPSNMVLNHLIVRPRGQSF